MALVIGAAPGIGTLAHAAVFVASGRLFLVAGGLFLPLLILGLLAAVGQLLLGHQLLLALILGIALFPGGLLLLRLLAVQNLVEILVQGDLLDQGERGVGNPVDAQSGGQDIAHPQGHQGHHVHHGLGGPIGGRAIGAHGDEAHGELDAGGDDGQQNGAPHGPAAAGELAEQVAGPVGQVNVQEAIVQVDEAVELSGKLRPMLMDELGQIDLFIGLAAVGHGEAQASGQSGDLGDHRLGQAHEVPHGHADDVVQGDQDGEGNEEPQAAGHGVDAFLGIQLRHGLLLLLLVVGIAGLDVVELALHAVHAQHALLALELEGQQHQLHHQGKQDQGHAIGPGPAVEQPGQEGKGNADIISERCKHGVVTSVFCWVGKTRFSGNRIIPAFVKGIASQKAPQRHKAAPQRPVFLHGLQGVFRAGGDIPAAGRKQRRHGRLIKPDDPQDGPLHDGSSRSRFNCLRRRR